jgi:hypothetical protein
MVLWAILPALAGLVYDRRRGLLRCDPVLEPRNARLPLLLPGAWGRLTQKKQADRQENTFEIQAGALPVEALEIPACGRHVSVRLDDQDLPAESQARDALRSVTLETPITLAQGMRLVITQS